MPNKYMIAVLLALLAALIGLVFAYQYLAKSNLLQQYNYKTLCTKPNALYGIPSKYEYISYNPSNDSIRTNGMVSSISCYYSLDIMYAIFNGTQEASVVYNLSVPSNLSDYTYPTGVNINIAEFRNKTSVAAFAKNFYSNSNGIIKYNTEGLISSNGSIAIHFQSSHIYIYNINTSEITFYPIYRNYKEYQLAFEKGNYFVIINTYGVNRTYSSTASKQILVHDYDILNNIILCSSISCL
ncbi:MAG: hypothetical protein QXR73_01675 [Candidatus Micrarchaeaceae archaeon]